MSPVGMDRSDESGGSEIFRDDGDGSLLARVEDLHLHFDIDRGVVQALDGVNFDLHEGEVLALVGETGCGKTITARSFVQLVPTPPGRYPRGSIWMRTDDECPECAGRGCETCFETGRAFVDLLDLSPGEIQEVRGKRIAMIFQDPETALNPSFTIKEHIAEAFLAHRGDEILESAGVDQSTRNLIQRRLNANELDPDRSRLLSYLGSIPPFRDDVRAIRTAIRERVVDVLRQTQIPSPREVLTKYPHELSGGQQQRVMIAMALTAKPDLLIADEATTALDVTTQARILTLLRDLQTEFGTSMLYITHDLHLVEDIADRVAVMYAGVLAEVGDVEDLYTNPLHPYTRGLLNSIPTETKLDDRLYEIEGSIPDLTNPPEGCRFCTRCPEVMDHCYDVDPPLVEEESDHVVACHLYPEDEVARAPAPPE